MRDARHTASAMVLFVTSLLSGCDDGNSPAARTSTAAPTTTASRTATPPATTTAVATATATSAATATPTAATSVVFSFDFRNGAQGWVAGFADYPPANEESFEFDQGIRTLPAELGSGSGFLLSSHNRSDDVFMFLTRRVGAED